MTLSEWDGAHVASNGLALLIVVILLALLTTRLRSWRDFPPPAARMEQPNIAVSLQSPESPPVPREPPPQPRAAPSHRVLPQQPAVVKAPAPAMIAAEPVAEETVPEAGAMVAASPSAAGAVPAADAHPDLEAQYAAGLRADIDHRTHPPDSAQYRLHRPSGEVRVGFIVLRSGEPKAVRVLHSSGSSILDDAALAIVSSGHYPAMSAKLFVGETAHTFSVSIEFRASG